MNEPPTIDELLEAARAHLRRVTPREAADLIVTRAALLVDIRPQGLRDHDGAISGAHVIERNVLEWRLDPASPHRIPEASSHDRYVILVCDESYASSLAAAALQQLGLRHATDVVGGFQAWKADGLPIEAGHPVEEP